MARPPKPIDWDLVEVKMAAGCNGIEIAQDFRLDRDTFYDRFKKEYGESFSDYSARQASVGEGNIKFVQYARAIGLTKKGDNSLLIHLGKVRLKQREPSTEVDIGEDTIKQFEALMNQISNLQEKDQVVSEEASST
jgi:hypothetical protein